MAYRRKKHSYEPLQSPIAAESHSLFAASELEEETEGDSLQPSSAVEDDTVTLEMRRRQASQNRDDFSRISISDSQPAVQPSIQRMGRSPLWHMSRPVQRSSMPQRSDSVQAPRQRWAVSDINTNAPQTIVPQQSPIQRQAMPTEDEDKALQRKPFNIIQRQTDLPDDEDEALQMKSSEPIQRQAMPDDEDEALQMKSSEPIQRQAMPDDEDEVLQMKSLEPIQRQGMPEDEDEALQMKSSEPIQRQGMPKDKDEDEALQMNSLESIQRQGMPEDEDEALQMKSSEPIQRQAMPEDEEDDRQNSPPLQRQESSSSGALSSKRSVENQTGMPAQLKSGLENLSGLDLSDTRVHYNSEKPAKIQALAYTQGQDIEIGPGQEQHLPHEGWHVVQQMQGRVQPTLQAKGVPINDNAALEQEATVMGERALQDGQASKNVSIAGMQSPTSTSKSLRTLSMQTVQRVGGLTKGTKVSSKDEYGEIYGIVKEELPNDGKYMVMVYIEQGVQSPEPYEALVPVDQTQEVANFPGQKSYAWVSFFKNHTDISTSESSESMGQKFDEYSVILRAKKLSEFLEVVVAKQWTLVKLVNLLDTCIRKGDAEIADKWLDIARVLTLFNQPDNVAAFAQIKDWTHAKRIELAKLFGAKSNKLTGEQWATIASAHANLKDREADVAAFARIKDWTHAKRIELTKLFCADSNKLTGEQWAAIASAHANLKDREADVAAFARIKDWTHAKRIELTKLFCADSNKLTGEQWAAIATAHANLKDKEADVAKFAQILNWKAENLAKLASLFGANAGFRTAKQWAEIAVAHTNLFNHEADVAAFARVSIWDQAKLKKLAEHYGQEPGKRTAQEWVDLASTPIYRNNEDGLARIARSSYVTEDTLRNTNGPNALQDRQIFAQLGMWSHTNLIILANAFRTGSGGHTAKTWVEIAKIPDLIDRHADVIALAQVADWKDKNIIRLANLFVSSAGDLEGLQWRIIASKPAFKNKERDVATFARITGWKSNEITSLAGLFRTDKGVKTATHWATIANLARFKDKPKDVKDFAYLDGWNPTKILALARLYNANAGVLNSSQWKNIADRAKFKDKEADVAAFARVEGWQPSEVETLAGHYQADHGGKSAETWAAIASISAFKDKADDVKKFALSGRSEAELKPLADLYSGSKQATGGKDIDAWITQIKKPKSLTDFADTRVNPDQVSAFTALLFKSKLALKIAREKKNSNDFSEIEWQAIGAFKCFKNKEADVAAFARILNWSIKQILTLAGLYNSDPGVLTAAQWATVAAQIELKDKPQDVATFARLEGWSWGAIKTLAGDFNGRTNKTRKANDWGAIAHLPKFTNQAIEVKNFAELATWTTANVLKLARAYDSDSGGRSAADWRNIAAGVVDKEDIAATFARMLNWTVPKIKQLITKFDTEQHNRTAEDWVEIATALVNQENNVAEFVQLPITWTPNHVAALVAEFRTRPGTRSAADWKTIAEGVAPNNETVAAAFARLDAGWNQVNHIKTLAQYFTADAGNHRLKDWVDIANVALYYNKPGEVASANRIQSLNQKRLENLGIGNMNTRGRFMQLAAWDSVNVLALADSFRVNNRGRNSSTWITIASLPRFINNIEAVETFVRVADWTNAKLIALAGLYSTSTGKLTLANWLTIARQSKFKDKDKDVADFARLPHWTPTKILALATHYNTNQFNKTATDWVAVASLPTFRDKQDDVKSLLKDGKDWNAANLIELARIYAQDSGAIDLAKWGAIAKRKKFENKEADVADFARLQNWKPDEVGKLAGHYQADPGGNSAETWVAIAKKAIFKDKADEVKAFAQSGRKDNELKTLVDLYIGSKAAGGKEVNAWITQISDTTKAVTDFADPRQSKNLGDVSAFAELKNWNDGKKEELKKKQEDKKIHTLEDWQAIGAYGCFKDNVADVNAFATIPDWNIKQVITLAGLYNSDCGALTVAQWVEVAKNAKLKDKPQDVAAFARLPNWEAANIVTLASNFQASTTLIPPHWLTLAKLARLKNDAEEVKKFAELAAWNIKNVLGLAQAYDTDNGGRTGDDWRTLAGATQAKNDERAVAEYARLSTKLTPVHLVAITDKLKLQIGVEKITALINNLHPLLTSQQINDFIAVLRSINMEKFYELATRANFAQTMSTLLAQGASHNNIEVYIDEYRKNSNRPSPNVFTDLLIYVKLWGKPHINIQRCLQTNMSNEAQWGQVIPHAKRFIQAGHTQPTNPSAFRGATLKTSGEKTYNSTASKAKNDKGGYHKIRIKIQRERANHFNYGHTYKHFEFTATNVNRAPFSSMWDHRITEAYQVISDGASGFGPIPEWATIPKEAHNGAWKSGNTQLQKTNYVISFSDKYDQYNYHRWNNGLYRNIGYNGYEVQVTQFYPKAWAMYEIHQNVLWVIGRLMGHLT